MEKIALPCLVVAISSSPLASLSHSTFQIPLYKQCISVCTLLLAGDWIHGSSRPKHDKGNEQINLPPFNARMVQFALIKVSS